MVSPPSLATDRALSAAVCPCEPPSKARRRCVEHRLRCALHNRRSEHVPVQYDPVKYRPCPTSTAEPPPTMLRSAGHPFPSPLSRGLELVVAQCQFNQLHFIQKLDAAHPVERSLCGVYAAGCIAIRALAIGRSINLACSYIPPKTKTAPPTRGFVTCGPTVFSSILILCGLTLFVWLPRLPAAAAGMRGRRHSRSRVSTLSVQRKSVSAVSLETSLSLESRLVVRRPDRGATVESVVARASRHLTHLSEKSHTTTPHTPTQAYRGLHRHRPGRVTSAHGHAVFVNQSRCSRCVVVTVAQLTARASMQRCRLKRTVYL